ncbi:hypothetical protein ERJ75_001521900 [Trypanosoma vivax]|nr:hypothetical protein TRVL_01875 [Trypanosoma vivax]KAH8606272.1 hypothetical protein ERJ75_001521900 [Trypanosoma vivax]
MPQTKKADNCIKVLWSNTREEWCLWFQWLRHSKCDFSLVFSILCVLAVVVGNVVLLIAINFWVSLLDKKAGDLNNPITAQVVGCCLLVGCFTILTALYIVVYGVKPLIRVLTSSSRVRGPLYRFWLIVASGSTNAITGVLAIYAIPYTPEFMQAVLLSVIPFMAQVWTYLLVVEERQRQYASFTLIGSLILCVLGILLSSFSSLVKVDTSTHVAPWEWSLVYFVSCVVFGLWCVVQRLYLDAITTRQDKKEASEITDEKVDLELSCTVECSAGLSPSCKKTDNAPDCYGAKEGKGDCGDVMDTSVSASDNTGEKLIVAQREWAKQDKDDLAAKVVLLFFGIVVQALVTFACVPVGAIPWFGGFDSVADAWRTFVATFNIIFESWENVRYGVVYTIGFFMSFLGCAYLNERSPTLASVVMQMAGPITSLVLIIAPAWDVFGEHGILGHKIGGVIMLLLAGCAYHVWEVTTLQFMWNRWKQQREEVGETAGEEAQQPQQGA